MSKRAAPTTSTGNPTTATKKNKVTQTAQYFGSAGAFSHVAAEKYFKAARIDVALSPSSNLSTLFDAVSSSSVDYCIVPYENSISGTISSTIVQLLMHPNLHIVGEMLDADELCLCTAPNAQLSDIKTVMSHSHLLQQSGVFLKTLPNTIACEPTFDSASACAAVGTDVSKAAIASRRAAEAHGLAVLSKNFADTESETRYVILAHKSNPAAKSSSHRLGRRCTVSYVLANRAGAMFKSLSCFAFRDLSIIKVSTVPLGGFLNSGSSGSSSSSDSNGSSTANRWDYVFVVDFIASANDAVNTAALEALKEFANSVRILGEYSAAEMRGESPSKNMHHLAAF